MAAPNYDTLFDIETAIEEAWQGRLQTDGLPLGVPAFLQRDVADLPTERVDIQFRLGGVTGNKRKMPNGAFCNGAWHGALTLVVNTKRDATKPLLHGQLRGRVRYLAQYFADKFGASVLPYHVLTSITESGTTPQVDIGDDCDQSAIQFACVVGLRDGAWPA